MARILVVDDQESARQLLEAVLAGVGHEVLLASGGDEAIEVYRRARPDLVIVDIFMPNKDGLDTISDLRREFGDVNIIVVSAGGNVGTLEVHGSAIHDDVLNDARRLGVRFAMSKPIDVSVILEAVEEALGDRP